MMKRYHACHCPFAKESILAEETVSAELCYCSLGHVMNFSEAFLNRKLEGKVVRSVLNGDMTCEYEITIPEDIMAQYVTPQESQTVIANYYRYYKAFCLSGIIEMHEGAVDWITPKKGKTGPSLAFHVQLSNDHCQEELQELIAGIKEKTVPNRWIITPDAQPGNIRALLKANGFQDLTENAEQPEPGMLLKASDFTPCSPDENPDVVCREVQTREDFSTWVDVVNTALHGWEMIDAENYYTCIKQKNMRFYLAEIDGKAVSTAATIQTGEPD